MPSGVCNINTIFCLKWLQKLTSCFWHSKIKLLSEGHYYVFLKEEQRRPGKRFTTLSWGGGTGNSLFQGFPWAFLGLEQAGSPHLTISASAFLGLQLTPPCQGPCPSRIQGYPQDERRWRVRQRERQKERDQTGMCSRVWQCFIFHDSLYTLSWYIFKGEISTQT